MTLTLLAGRPPAPWDGRTLPDLDLDTYPQMDRIVEIGKSWLSGVVQAQGDFLLIPWPDDLAADYRARLVARAVLVRQPGVVLLPSRHPHRLVPADGRIGWAPDPTEGGTLGLVCVPDGGAATVIHAEHDTLLVGPGYYVARGQRTWTGYRSLPVRD